MSTPKQGGILKGRKHAQCGSDGCGIKIQAGPINKEAEGGEFLLCENAMQNPAIITTSGTKRQIAEKINGSSGTVTGNKTLQVNKGQYVINAAAMVDKDTFTVTGTRFQIASAINADKGYGIEFAPGATITSSKTKNLKQDNMATKKKTKAPKVTKYIVLYNADGVMRERLFKTEAEANTFSDEVSGSVSPIKLAKGGSVSKDWGTQDDFDTLYDMFPDNHAEAKTFWNKLTKKQQEAFINNLHETDAASEYLAESWEEFVNAKSQDDYWKNATTWDEMAKGGGVGAPMQIEPYDEENFPTHVRYLKKVISDVFGPPNRYSGSADWGGMPVWTVTGDEFQGTFIVIDDNDSVILMTRQLDEDNEENINEDIEKADYDYEFDNPQWTGLLELLQTAYSLKQAGGKKLAKGGKVSSSKNEFKIGDNVIHDRLGYGQILAVNPDNYEVVFWNNQMQTYLITNVEKYPFSMVKKTGKYYDETGNSFDGNTLFSEERMEQFSTRDNRSKKTPAKSATIATTDKLFLITDNNPDQYRRAKPNQLTASEISKRFDLNQESEDIDGDDENFEPETLRDFLEFSIRDEVWANEEWTIENIGSKKLAKGGAVDKSDTTTTKLAKEFSAILRSWLTPEQLTEINQKNETAAYTNADATHDYCDPNQAMIDAFEKVFGKEIDFQSDEDSEIINAAWALARKNKFYVEGSGTKLAKGGPVANTKRQNQIAILKAAIAGPVGDAAYKAEMQVSLDKLLAADKKEKPVKAKTLGQTSHGAILEYADVEPGIISELENQGELTTSDAQGILLAHEDFAREKYGLGFGADQIAKSILTKSSSKPASANKNKEAFEKMGLHRAYNPEVDYAKEWSDYEKYNKLTNQTLDFTEATDWNKLSEDFKADKAGSKKSPKHLTWDFDDESNLSASRDGIKFTIISIGDGSTYKLLANGKETGEKTGKGKSLFDLKKFAENYKSSSKSDPKQTATQSSGKTGPDLVKYVEKQINSLTNKPIYFKGNAGSWIKGKIESILPTSSTKEHWNIEFYPVGAGKEMDTPMVSDKLTTKQVDELQHGSEIKNKYTLVAPESEVIKDFDSAAKEIDLCHEESKTARVNKQRTNPPVKKKPAEILKNKQTSYKKYAISRIEKKDPKKVDGLKKILDRHEKEIADYLKKK